MITEKILNMIFNLVDSIANLIPNLSINLVGSLAGLIEIFSLSSFFIPWGTIIQCMIAAFALYNLSNVMSLVNWIIKKIPGLS